MTAKEKQAYDWALNQNHQSVAADYARTLALYIKQMDAMFLAIEELYPNWHKFRDLAEAIRWHTKSQDIIINRLRKRVNALTELFGTSVAGTWEVPE